ncbi:hypothetical protein FQN54_008877 [Arachnomyces sp. PD_36]|nr:hypothetical protein FQN54_008877 [Arachnomyces sp. PD_36]
MSSAAAPTPTLLLSNLPPKTFIGIDLTSFASTPNFHGIKDLTPGWHFLYTGTSESFSLRSGSWFCVGGDADAGDGEGGGAVVRRGGGGDVEIRIWKWDEGIEAVRPLRDAVQGEREEAMRRRANLGRVWQAGGLFGYRSQPGTTRKSKRNDEDDGGDGGGNNEEEDEDRPPGEREKDWYALTKYISPGLVSRILGEREFDTEGRSRWTVTSASTAPQDKDNIPGLTEQEAASAGGVAGEEEKELTFLPVDLKKTWREGAVGRERTEAAQDRSWALGDIVERCASDGGGGDGETQILGELQFTFLMVLLLANYSCLEQWKRLLGLVFTCRAAVKPREGFFIKVLKLLKLQLEHCDDVEGGLFEMDGDEGGALLKKLFTQFRTGLDEVDGPESSRVNKELEELQQWVKSQYGWELRRGAIVRRGMLELEDGEQVEMEVNDAESYDETGEYAPVVVDLGENEASRDVDMMDTKP